MSATTKDEPLDVVLNVPNQLTAARVVLAIVLFALMPFEMYKTCLVLFLVAASTDWVDGYLARKFNQVTRLGRILDPFADKIIICGTFIFLVGVPNGASGVTAWMAVVVVGRELLVTVLRSFFEQQGTDFSANFSGKLKMVFQCAAVVASMLTLIYAADGPPQWLMVSRFVLIWLAIISTVYSGVVYIVAAAKLLRESQ